LIAIWQEAYFFCRLGGDFCLEKKQWPPETERLKLILIEARQRGELSVNMTAKEMVEQLVQQLKQVSTINHQ
jgi:hypothetical protein